MKIEELIRDELDRINSYDDLIEKEVDLGLYPEIEELTCGGEVPLEDIYDSSNIKDIYTRFKPYLDNPDISSESQIAPVIESLGNVYICIGFGEHNKGFVYYLDFDFGCFILDKNLDNFLSKLVDA